MGHDHITVFGIISVMATGFVIGIIGDTFKIPLYITLPLCFLMGWFWPW